jgi:hypothetical protein
MSSRRSGLKATIQHVVVAKGRTAYFLDLFGDFTKTTADRALFKQIYGTWRPT